MEGLNKKNEEIGKEYKVKLEEVTLSDLTKWTRVHFVDQSGNEFPVTNNVEDDYNSGDLKLLEGEVVKAFPSSTNEKFLQIGE